MKLRRSKNGRNSSSTTNAELSHNLYSSANDSVASKDDILRDLGADVPSTQNTTIVTATLPSKKVKNKSKRKNRSLSISTSRRKQEQQQQQLQREQLHTSQPQLGQVHAAQANLRSDKTSRRQQQQQSHQTSQGLEDNSLIQSVATKQKRNRAAPSSKSKNSSNNTSRTKNNTSATTTANRSRRSLGSQVQQRDDHEEEDEAATLDLTDIESQDSTLLDEYSVMTDNTYGTLDTTTVRAMTSRSRDDDGLMAKAGNCLGGIKDEITGTYQDTVTSMSQVCGAFTLTDKDINAVSKHIRKFKRELER